MLAPMSMYYHERVLVSMLFRWAGGGILTHGILVPFVVAVSGITFVIYVNGSVFVHMSRLSYPKAGGEHRMPILLLSKLVIRLLNSLCRDMPRAK